jgi:glutathione S-transferase
MPQLVVHSTPGSPYGRAVLAALEEKGSRYRFAPVPPGGSKTEPHLQRHPFGRVPVFEHGDFTLYETQAILRYIDRILPSPALTPIEREAAARMDQLLNMCDWYLMQGVNNVIGFHRIIAPRLLGLTPDEEAIKAAMPNAHVVCNEIGRFLGSKPFLTGDAVSLADLLIACHLDFLSATPEWTPLTAAIPHLVSWLERMNARASFKATTWERVSEMAKAA